MSIAGSGCGGGPSLPTVGLLQVQAAASRAPALRDAKAGKLFLNKEEKIKRTERIVRFSCFPGIPAETGPLRPLRTVHRVARNF